MASRYLFITKINPAGPDDVAISASGGTITGSNGVAEIVFDDAEFTTAEGKKTLILAVEQMLNYLKESKAKWPLA